MPDLCLNMMSKYLLLLKTFILNMRLALDLNITLLFLFYLCVRGCTR
jgi:hypothetical protein